MPTAMAQIGLAETSFTLSIDKAIIHGAADINSTPCCAAPGGPHLIEQGRYSRTP